MRVQRALRPLKTNDDPPPTLLQTEVEDLSDALAFTQLRRQGQYQVTLTTHSHPEGPA
jgi:hypothetical protein